MHLHQNKELFNANVYIEDCQQIIHVVIVLIATHKLWNNTETFDKLEQQLKLIDHILDILELNGYVKLSKKIGGSVAIFYLSLCLSR